MEVENTCEHARHQHIGMKYTYVTHLPHISQTTCEKCDSTDSKINISSNEMFAQIRSQTCSGSGTHTK